MRKFSFKRSFESTPNCTRVTDFKGNCFQYFERVKAKVLLKSSMSTTCWDPSKCNERKSPNLENSIRRKRQLETNLVFKWGLIQVDEAFEQAKWKNLSCYYSRGRDSPKWNPCAIRQPAGFSHGVWCYFISGKKQSLFFILSNEMTAIKERIQTIMRFTAMNCVIRYFKMKTVSWKEERLVHVHLHTVASTVTRLQENTSELIQHSDSPSKRRDLSVMKISMWSYFPLLLQFHRMNMENMHDLKAALTVTRNSMSLVYIWSYASCVISLYRVT